MVRLLNKSPRGARLIFGGDEIDRGPHSRQVVEFAMNNKIPTVCGNHEDMLLAYYYHLGCHCSRDYGSGAWLDNGGVQTVRNWPISKTNDRRGGGASRKDEYVGGRVPEAVLDWVAALPPYIKFDGPDEERDSNGRALLLSHTGFGLDADDGDWFRALWGRYGLETDAFVRDENDNPIDDGWFRVFGHTPAKHPVIKDTFANIDTGAAYGGRNGGGILSALLWPTKDILTQIYDETPVEPNFSIREGVLVNRG